MSTNSFSTRYQQRRFTVKRQQSLSGIRFAVWDRLAECQVEGGFFSENAAHDAADQWNEENLAGLEAKHVELPD